MATNFVPLRCHSNFSFLSGPVDLNRLLETSATLGYEAVGLTDTDGLYGAVEFYCMAQKFGIKPLIGCEIETMIGRGVFLAKDMTGYGNLCRLSTIGMLHERKVTLEEIASLSSGLILIQMEKVYIRRLKEIFGDDLYLGLESSDTILSRLKAREMVRLGEEYQIKTVAADPVYFIEEYDLKVHHALTAIKNLTTYDNLDYTKLAHPESYLKTARTMGRLYNGYPEAIKNTIEIAEKCNLELPVDKLNFPEFTGVARLGNFRLLRQKAEAGLLKRYRSLKGDIYSQFELELAVIKQMGFVDYFLIVNEIVEYCKQSGIPIVGRGSAASSIISYALGITEVDPIGQNLYFARFLNEARSDPPDIDLDLCWRRRDDVLEFVYEKYGRNRVAMICTLNTFAARGAIRELAKIFGLAGDEISDFTKRLPWGHLGDLLRTKSRYPECADLPLDTEPFRSILKLAHRIEGYPRHLSIHCGGIVIAPNKLTDLVPLQMSAKGIAITQYDMHSIAKLGLVKIDLLGQRGLSTIVDGEQLAHKKSGIKVKYDYDDSKTFELLRAGRTVGVFQIESPGLRALLIEMQPKTINDITLALALIRPGASESGMKKVFLERLAGQRKVEYAHPLLEPVLSETLGNIIYQEQVLRSAEALAGFTPGQADMLRQSITKKRFRSEFLRFAKMFTDQAKNRGVDEDRAREVFKLLTQFAGYGFCKAHAATYAVLSYRGSYLKAHYPIEYMTAMLNNFCGYYQPFVYAEEARRFGAVLKPPDIDKPSELCTTDGKTLFLGLAFVKNMSENTIDRIIQERNENPFYSLADFLIRVRPSRNEVESLIRIGAFDYLNRTRPELMWYLKIHGEKLLKCRQDTPILINTLPPDIPFAPELPDYDLDERLTAEQDILEIPVSCHPTERIANNNGHIKAAELSRLNGKDVRIIGRVVDRKRIKTANNKLMVFLTMEDNTDYFEVTLFPEVYNKFGQRIFKKPLLDVSGKVDNQRGVISIIADKLQPCT